MAAHEAQFVARSDASSDNDIILQAQEGLTLILPWGRNPMRLGTTFQSKRQSTLNPWSEETPFVLSDLHMIPKELHLESGTISTFKKVHTTSESETRDHLTLGFKAGIGVPFLAKASVKGTFDQDVQENKDSDKISLQTSFRAGTIQFQRQPRLTKEAIIELKYGNGYAGLCDKYGDYFLSGYRLGGDTGILMSASGHTRKEIDKMNIKATLTVLLVPISKSWTKDFKSFVAGRNVKLLGFDTLDAMTWKRAAAVGDDVKEMQAWGAFDEELDVGTLRADAEGIVQRSENGMERIMSVLQEKGYRSGDSLTFLQCEELVRQGVVVELLLEPMARLRDVIRWRLEDNII